MAFYFLDKEGKTIGDVGDMGFLGVEGELDYDWADVN